MALTSASFAALGICMILPGALLPLLVDQFDMRLVEAGSMLALQPIGYLLSVLSASRLIEALGMRRVLQGGFFTAAAGYAGFGLVSAWAAGAAMMFVTGAGIGIVEVAANSLIVNRGGERRSSLLNFAHFFFGIGSVVTPAVATQAVAAGVSWSQAFLCTAGVLAAVAAAWQLLPGNDAEGYGHEVGAQALHRRFIVLCALMLGVYVGTEMGIGNWLTKYLVSVRGVELTAAGRALSLYWLGLTVGRLALSLMSHHFAQARLLVGLAVFASLAFCGALLASAGAFEIAGFALIGLGFSGIFPAVIGLGGRYHQRSIAKATSIMIGGAGIGAIVIPWVMSGIADAIGLRAGMAFYGAMCLVMVVLAAVMARSLPDEL